MNVYRGTNSHDVTVNGSPLHPCTDVINHSPTGFAWGYAGSGPAQLALAIMCNEFGTDVQRHPAPYQEFKRDVVSSLERESFQLTSQDVINWLAQYRSKKVE